MGRFEVVIEEANEKTNTVKVLFKEVPIYVDFVPKELNEDLKKAFEDWVNFVKDADGAVATAVYEDNTIYSTIAFLKTVFDSEKYRAYEYRVGLFEGGVMVFDKEEGKFFVLNEEPEIINDASIDQLRAQGKVSDVIIFHVFK